MGFVDFLSAHRNRKAPESSDYTHYIIYLINDFTFVLKRIALGSEHAHLESMSDINQTINDVGIRKTRSGKIRNRLIITLQLTQINFLPFQTNKF